MERPLGDAEEQIWKHYCILICLVWRKTILDSFAWFYYKEQEYSRPRSHKRFTEWLRKAFLLSFLDPLQVPLFTSLEIILHVLLFIFCYCAGKNLFSLHLWKACGCWIWNLKGFLGFFFGGGRGGEGAGKEQVEGLNMPSLGHTPVADFF